MSCCTAFDGNGGCSDDVESTGEAREDEEEDDVVIYPVNEKEIAKNQRS